MAGLKITLTSFCFALVSTIQCYPATYIKNDNPAYILPGSQAPCAQEITYNNIYSNSAGLVGNSLYPQVIGAPQVGLEAIVTSPLATQVGSPFINIPGALETIVTSPLATQLGSSLINIPSGIETILSPTIQPVLTNSAVDLVYATNPGLTGNIVAPSLYSNVINPLVPNVIGNSFGQNIPANQVVANNNPLVAQSPYLSNRGNIFNM